MRSTFWAGVGNILNIAGDVDGTFPTDDDGFAVDAQSIAGDWKAVGEDLRTVADKLAKDEPRG